MTQNLTSDQTHKTESILSLNGARNKMKIGVRENLGQSQGQGLTRIYLRGHQPLCWYFVCNSKGSFIAEYATIAHFKSLSLQERLCSILWSGILLHRAAYSQIRVYLKKCVS